MVERLVRRVRSRFVFVVGKGGVGKTTAAGAVALALADRGERVHLLSTDPAHSVGDLFETDLAGGAPTPSPCGDALVLEELDAPARWAVWRDVARAPLVDLVDRGTYIDREDVEAFLDLSLPGVDEVAAVLRLTDLQAGDVPRVVVDTAPTGHTLRLLAVGEMLRGWAEAFDAMDAKARAVVEGLTHRSVRLPAAEVIDDLRERARRFEEAVVGQAEALVVERADAMVAAESSRLRSALAARGLRVAARIRVAEPHEEGTAAAPGGEPAGDDVLIAPFAPDLVGCEGVRRWGEPTPAAAGAEKPSGARSPAEAETAAAARAEVAEPDARVHERIRGLPRDLVLFVGKGGVGKTTCAAACALALADERDVELLGVDPAGSLGDALGIEVPAEGVEVAPRLRARQLDADRALREFKERYRGQVEEAFERVGLKRAAALDRRVVETLLELAPPGVDELLAVSALLEASRPGTTRVLDTAPTGHLLRLLETPEQGLAWVRQVMRVLVKTRAALGLDALAERLLELAKQLKDLNLRLRNPERSGAVVVTLSGPLDRPEAERLLRRLDGLGVPVAALVRNRWSEHGQGAGAAPVEAPLLCAPVRRPPPVGVDGLRDFLATWSAA